MVEWKKRFTLPSYNFMKRSPEVYTDFGKAYDIKTAVITSRIYGRMLAFCMQNHDFKSIFGVIY